MDGGEGVDVGVTEGQRALLLHGARVAVVPACSAARYPSIAGQSAALRASLNTVTAYVRVAAAYTAWMVFFERRPWPTLTLIVSLEAIFLSTFVMIVQNRQAAFAKARARWSSASRGRRQPPRSSRCRWSASGRGPRTV